jgi:KUP system potassium uptake protein
MTASSHPSTHAHSAAQHFAWGGVLLAFGIVFGDIGTSPLYVFKAIIGESTPINETLVYGGVSAVFWTLTFQTTLKYVLITMRADNNGEGGIFSLYTLIRRHGRWLLWPAILGGSFMIADSLITPPISVTSAMEGLQQLNAGLEIVPFTIGIILILFLFQQTGTSRIGRFFGPAMIVWFGMLATLGVANMWSNPAVLQAINPYYAYNLLVNYPNGFWVLGGVFLCTTGAEALYADMGHVGRKNIQIAWIFVKTALILCYFGEAAMLLQHQGETLEGIHPFYDMVPDWFLVPSIIIATSATIIASQALISGTFTLLNEAVRLNVWPKLRVEFPTEMRGQIYVPTINWLMMAGCILVVLYFRESSNMEAAYGLSVTLTMLMTTILLAFYLYTRRVNIFLRILLIAVFLTIETVFLISNLSKVAHGGWLTLLLGALLVSTMYVWYVGRQLKAKYLKYVRLGQFQEQLALLSNDRNQPKYATHLVYLTSSDTPEKIEERIVESILAQRPKRADLYWFVHVDVDDAPYTMAYSAKIVEPEEIVYVRFRLGFRVVPRLSLFLKQVTGEMIANKEVTIEQKYFTTERQYLLGDFRFVVMKSFLSLENNLPFWQNMIMQIHFFLSRISYPDAKAYGLDYNNVVLEQVPLVISEPGEVNLVREE